MEKIIIKNKLVLLLVVCLTLTAYLSSCKKIVYPIVAIDPGLNMTQYFENNPDQFSLFDQILERTGYAGFLGAYGAYTVFAPNNDAINLYLKDMGKASVADVDIDVLKSLVQYHVIKDTLSTGNFKDGKLPTPTLYGQYLLTGASNVNGVSSYSINNNQALVVQTNIILGNGILHVIDHVLKPATQTLAQLLDADKQHYTIFTKVLNATGYYDVLNVLPANAANPKQAYFTVLAVTDSAIRAEFNTNDNTDAYNKMVAKYSTKGNPKDPTDSLNLYAVYHILPENSYLTDIISSGSHHTLSPTDVISDVLEGQTITINKDPSISEPGTIVNRALSNITATNGVLNSVFTNYRIKVRLPQALYWDCADLPEFRANTSVFRRPGKGMYAPSPGPEAVQASGTAVANNQVGYWCDALTSNTHFYWNDYLLLSQFRTNGVFNQAMFHTPTIVKGRYKVWFCWSPRSSNSTLSNTSTTNAGGQFFFDGGDGIEQPLQNVITTLGNTNGVFIPNSTDSGPVLESKGFKRYTADAVLSEGNTVYNATYTGYLLGVVNVITTDRHYLRMKAIGGANNGTLAIDMIHFIPITQDQEQPRFRKDGTTAVIPY